jgi:hypothetical protein
MVAVPDHSGLAVSGMNCLLTFEHWDCGFESHARHGRLCAFIVCVVLCVGSGLATGLITRPSSPTDCV